MDRYRCPECGVARPLDAFYRTASARGHMRVCKHCHIARVTRRQAERYSSDPEYRDRKTSRVVRRQAERYSSDPTFAVSKVIATSIRQSLRLGKAGRRWEDTVGYSVNDLMTHLEARFQPGMTWANFGEWHIDHIVPRAAFRFESPDDAGFRDCWALENLQPLWAADNIAKSDRLADGTRARRQRLTDGEPPPFGSAT